MTPDLSILSICGRMPRVMWEDAEAIASTILVPEAHENSLYHYALFIHGCSPRHPHREKQKEKGG